MAIDAIIAVLADVGTEAVAATVLEDVVGTAIADVAVEDAVATVVADGLATGATDAAIAGAADAAGATAAEAAGAGLGADAATAAGVDGAAAATGGAVAPATEAGVSGVADTLATEGAVAPGAESTVASVEATPAGDVVNGVQTGANATGVENAAGAVNPADANAAATASNEAVASGGSAPITDANGNVLVDAGGPGQAPVYDAGAGTPGLNNPYGAGDIPLGTALGDYASALTSSLGTTGLLGAGALAGATLAGGGNNSNLTGPVGSGDVKYEWGQGTPLVDPGLNPGYIGHAASMPYYHSDNPTDAQYYWGVHAPVNTPADIANYNTQAGAPTTPWGAGAHAVGGGEHFDPAQFVNQYILNPAWSGVNNATSPGYVAPGPAVPK